MRRSLAVGAAAVAALALSLTVWAQAGGALTLPWSSVDGGGGTSAGGDFTLDGTIGQPDAGGKLTGGGFAVEGGFIPGVAATPVVAGTCGDLNDDGVINVFDAIIELQIIVGLITPTQAQLILGDVVRDGTINVFDAILLLQDIVGLIEITECGPPPPTATPTPTPVSMLVAKDIQGDVGQIVPMDIVLENVTTGVSGFQLTMQVADPSVAIIESIAFPSYDDPITGINFNSTIPLPPTASTTVTATDLGQAIEPDSPTGYVLFTLQIKLLRTSTTSVTVSKIGKLNDDFGADIDVVQIIAGSVTVN